jgi:hypothetical protein
MSSRAAGFAGQWILSRGWTVQGGKMVMVDRPTDGDGCKEERWDERNLLSTLEDGLAQTHTLLHLPAEQTA